VGDLPGTSDTTVRFAKAVHALSDLEAAHELVPSNSANGLEFSPFDDRFLHQPRPLREPMFHWWAPRFAIQASEYVNRYYSPDGEYLDNEYFEDGRVSRVAAGHMKRLLHLQATSG
jgi:hypothetical protein